MLLISSGPGELNLHTWRLFWLIPSRLPPALVYINKPSTTFRANNFLSSVTQSCCKWNMSAKRRSEGSIHEYNETKVTDFEEQEAPHAAFTTLIYKKQKPNPATIMFAQREEAHRQPQQEATPPQESPVKHDKDAAIRILTQSGKPLPLNLDTLTSEKAKSTNTEQYNIPDLATTLIYMARGQEGVTKLQDKDLTVFRCPVSGPVGGSGSTRNSKFVEIQRNENVVWVCWQPQSSQTIAPH